MSQYTSSIFKQIGLSSIMSVLRGQSALDCMVRIHQDYRHRGISQMMRTHKIKLYLDEHPETECILYTAPGNLKYQIPNNGILILFIKNGKYIVHFGFCLNFQFGLRVLPHNSNNQSKVKAYFGSNIGKNCNLVHLYQGV